MESPQLADFRSKKRGAGKDSALVVKAPWTQI